MGRLPVLHPHGSQTMSCFDVCVWECLRYEWGSCLFCRSSISISPLLYISAKSWVLVGFLLLASGRWLLPSVSAELGVGGFFIFCIRWVSPSEVAGLFLVAGQGPVGWGCHIRWRPGYRCLSLAAASHHFVLMHGPELRWLLQVPLLHSQTLIGPACLCQLWGSLRSLPHPSHSHEHPTESCGKKHTPLVPGAPGGSKLSL